MLYTTIIISTTWIVLLTTYQQHNDSEINSPSTIWTIETLLYLTIYSIFCLLFTEGFIYVTQIFSIAVISNVILFMMIEHINLNRFKKIVWLISDISIILLILQYVSYIFMFIFLILKQLF